jgi:hypothetical protein
MRLIVGLAGGLSIERMEKAAWLAKQPSGHEDRSLLD